MAETNEKRCILTFQAQRWDRDQTVRTWSEEFDATEAVLALGKEKALALESDDYDSDELAPQALLDHNEGHPFFVDVSGIADFFSEED